MCDSFYIIYFILFQKQQPKKKNHIIDLEKKQKQEIDRLEKDFGLVLNAEFNDLKEELERTSKVSLILN